MEIVLQAARSEEKGMATTAYQEDLATGSICGEKHKNGRVYSGLYICKKTGEKINVDVNAALNIARRLGYRIEITKKIESYIATHCGIRPLTPARGLTPKTPAIETPPFRAGRGSSLLVFTASVICLVVCPPEKYSFTPSVSSNTGRSTIYQLAPFRGSRLADWYSPSFPSHSIMRAVWSSFL